MSTDTATRSARPASHCRHLQKHTEHSKHEGDEPDKPNDQYLAYMCQVSFIPWLLSVLLVLFLVDSSWSPFNPPHLQPCLTQINDFYVITSTQWVTIVPKYLWFYTLYLEKSYHFVHLNGQTIHIVLSKMVCVVVVVASWRKYAVASTLETNFGNNRIVHTIVHVLSALLGKHWLKILF